MSEPIVFDRVLVSLHEAMLDDARWPAASAHIVEACGAVGSELVVAEGPGSNVDVLLAWFYHGARRREDLEREYFELYHEHDERVPRLRQLPDGQVVHVTTLYDEAELRTSRTYNEMLGRTGTRNALNVRLDGPYGSRIIWAIGDPVEGDAWEPEQIEMVERLLPHIRQYVQVRQALVGAEALGASLAELLDNTRIGVVYLDRRGRIVEANDRAFDFIGRNNGLLDRDGYLRARRPTDDARLQSLLAQALPSFGRGVAGGSLIVRRTPGHRRLVLHISPVTPRQAEFSAQRVAALALIVEPGSHPQIDADHVGAVLGLTPAESRVATWLAEGKTVREIASETRRQESSIRWLIKQVYNKQGISRQADLMRLVLSLAGSPKRRE
ncbi:MAG: hypothetical protein OXP66_02755 [Candidatus Tectomicrobia bacterium]|nr:hypothetical protein [Candidatus Tectomicrobia bacterium]